MRGLLALTTTEKRKTNSSSFSCIFFYLLMLSPMPFLSPKEFRNPFLHPPLPSWNGINRWKKKRDFLRLVRNAEEKTSLDCFGSGGFPIFYSLSKKLANLCFFEAYIFYHNGSFFCSSGSGEGGGINFHKGQGAFPSFFHDLCAESGTPSIHPLSRKIGDPYPTLLSCLPRLLTRFGMSPIEEDIDFVHREVTRLKRALLILHILAHIVHCCSFFHFAHPLFFFYHFPLSSKVGGNYVGG